MGWRVRGAGLVVVAWVVASGCYLVHGPSGSSDAGPRRDASVPSVAPEVRSLSVGARHSCAVTAVGEAWCWGANDHGQLGDGSTVANALAPVRVVGVEDARAVSAGNGHTCIVTAAGNVVCVGDNRETQLGNDTRFDQRELVAVEGAEDVVALSAGLAHNCALHSDGGVSCWGWNRDGQVGQGRRDWHLPARRLEGLSDIVALAAGTLSTCALDASGRVYCWGGSGVAGDDAVAPRAIEGLPPIVSIAGGRGAACAIDAEGNVYCWGLNEDGHLGTGDSGRVEMPTPVRAIDRAESIAMGSSHLCALHADARVSCWGFGESGALGDGTLESRTTGAAVLGLRASTLGQIHQGYHSCAVSADTGRAVCWGRNSSGELGDGTGETRTTPVEVRLP